MKEQHDNFNLPPQPTQEIVEEFSLLMSLCLDDLLDVAERQRFEAYLARYSALAHRWRDWQRVHHKLWSAPHMEPPAGFVLRVETRLLQQDRRRHLWQGAFFALCLVGVWVGMLLLATGLGAYLLFNQGDWLTDVIHNLAYFSSTAANWLSTLRNSTYTLAASPQAMALCLGYIALAAILLSAWFRFLRQTTTDVESASVTS
ncbi:MAG TPA: hypothetical protein PKE45_15280 [Caldilineaceae bacterium]|nr:hypothetical protein [Caldilineaceae bacterium]